MNSSNDQRPLRPELFENYQSLNLLGKDGNRDTESRLKKYGISDLIDSTSCVLDVGCNAGAISLLLAQDAGHVTGIDVHAPFIEIAERDRDALKATNVDFIASEFRAELFEKNSFDLILSLAAHYWMTNLDQYLSDLVRLTRSGGYILVESHNLDQKHHQEDWGKVCSFFKKYSLISSALTREDLTYCGDRSIHKREHCLYQINKQIEE